MDFQTVVVALIVSVVAPIILSYLNGRQRRAEAAQLASIKASERQADWDRQDTVAARVLEVAKAAAAAQVANASTLHDIHTLVNSDMTAARTAELSTTRLLIIALKRIVDPDTETKTAIDAAEIRAVELQTILADRLVAQTRVEADAAAAAAAAGRNSP